MSLNILLEGIAEKFSGKEFTAKDLIEFVTRKDVVSSPTCTTLKSTCEGGIEGGDIILNKKGSNKKALKNEGNMVNAINNRSAVFPIDFCNDAGVVLNISNAMKVTKKNGFSVEHTKKWGDLKNGTKETHANSKSDICITCEDKHIGLSLKSGKGRLTSADCYETCAIFNTVYDNKYKGDLKIKVIKDEIINLMDNLGKKTPINNTRTITFIRKEIKKNPELIDEDIIWGKKLEETEKRCNELWGILKKSHCEYVKDILFECVSGEYKFGVNSGRANWLIVTDGSYTTKIDKSFKLNKRTDELDNYLLECSKSPNAFKCKSGGTGKVMWIRFL